MCLQTELSTELYEAKNLYDKLIMQQSLEIFLSKLSLTVKIL